MIERQAKGAFMNNIFFDDELIRFSGSGPWIFPHASPCRLDLFPVRVYDSVSIAVLAAQFGRSAVPEFLCWLCSCRSHLSESSY